METSDSEYFESADEEVPSDNEDVADNACKLEVLKIVDKPKVNPVQNSKLSELKDSSATEAKNANVESKKAENICDPNANQTVKKDAVFAPKAVDNEHCLAKLSNIASETTRDTSATIVDNYETENMWDNEDEWEVDNTAAASADKNEDSERNMWSNDDWDDIENEALINKESKTNLQLSSKKETKSVQHENKANKTEETSWNDAWEPIESESSNNHNHNDSDNNTKSNDSWGAWGNWGISSVLSTATSITNQVSQGLSQVLESSIGVPNPEDLAKIHKEESKKLHETSELPQSETSGDSSQRSSGFGFSNLVSGVTQITKLVEETGTKVISGGLDTLETIGKKTVEILQENDPGLKSRTAFLKIEQNKPILSHVLREAKEKAENENKILEQKHYSKKANYETLFDDHQGLVHLEALEMLSKQCNIKLENLLESYTGEQLSEMEETIEQVKELCELPEDEEEDLLKTEDLEQKLNSSVQDINVKITYEKLVSTWNETEEWLGTVNLSICNENEIHQQAIESLAQLTAIAVEQFHKAGELLLIKDHRSTADEADSLVQLTITLTALMSLVSSKFSEKLNLMAKSNENKADVNSLITNIFFEAANSSSYVRDAFKLLIPVLLIGAV